MFHGQMVGSIHSPSSLTTLFQVGSPLEMSSPKIGFFDNNTSHDSSSEKKNTLGLLAQQSAQTSYSKGMSVFRSFSKCALVLDPPGGTWGPFLGLILGLSVATKQVGSKNL